MLRNTRLSCIEQRNMALYGSGMEQDETFSERLSRLRNEKGITLEQLANAAGVSYQAVQSWVKGKSTPQGTQRQMRVAQVLNVSVSELMYGKGNSAPDPQPLMRPIPIWDDLPEDSDYIFLPAIVFDSNASAVTGWRLDDAGRQPFPKSLARRNGIDVETAAWMEMADQSMAPRLQAGDFLVVDYTPVAAITDGMVYLLLIEGEIQVRRLFKEFGNVRIACDSQDKTRHRERIVPADKWEYVKIIGQVKAVSGGV